MRCNDTSFLTDFDLVHSIENHLYQERICGIKPDNKSRWSTTEGYWSAKTKTTDPRAIFSSIVSNVSLLIEVISQSGLTSITT